MSCHDQQAPRGLSPRARGKRTNLGVRCYRSGPIPAGAGETSSAISVSVMVRAYPRGRGGNRPCDQRHQGQRGLSPRARGKPPAPTPAPLRWGPIPAGAGETRTTPASRRRCWAYPRGRGGNTTQRLLLLTTAGLSPRARGKRIRPRPGRNGAGPIPAGAGETFLAFGHCRVLWAYPRGRGGNWQKILDNLEAAGLSPRARGKRSCNCCASLGIGPIPAGAGETGGRQCSGQRRWAYPRGRGGNLILWRQHRHGRGLSPRARGKPSYAGYPPL